MSELKTTYQPEDEKTRAVLSAKSFYTALKAIDPSTKLRLKSAKAGLSTVGPRHLRTGGPAKPSVRIRDIIDVRG